MCCQWFSRGHPLSLVFMNTLLFIFPLLHPEELLFAGQQKMLVHWSCFCAVHIGCMPVRQVCCFTGERRVCVAALMASSSELLARSFSVKLVSFLAVPRISMLRDYAWCRDQQCYIGIFGLSDISDSIGNLGELFSSSNLQATAVLSFSI